MDGCPLKAVGDRSERLLEVAGRASVRLGHSVHREHALRHHHFAVVDHQWCPVKGPIPGADHLVQSVLYGAGVNVGDDLDLAGMLALLLTLHTELNLCRLESVPQLAVDFFPLLVRSCSP